MHYRVSYSQCSITIIRSYLSDPCTIILYCLSSSSLNSLALWSKYSLVWLPAF
jgi:hypothetical protein